MQILRCNNHYIDDCLSIAKELTQYFNEAGIQTMREDLTKHLLYVALENNEVYGFLALTHKNDHVFEISWMAVKLGQQHQGVGSALIEFVSKELKALGVKLLEVKTLAEDEEYLPYEITRAFYRKMGFIHVETINPYPDWGPGNPCAIFVKILV